MGGLIGGGLAGTVNTMVSGAVGVFIDISVITVAPITLAIGEKAGVLIKALFRRCTLCTSRKSDEIRAQIFQEMPQADCAVLP